MKTKTKTPIQTQCPAVCVCVCVTHHGGKSQRKKQTNKILAKTLIINWAAVTRSSSRLVHWEIHWAIIDLTSRQFSVSHRTDHLSREREINIVSKADNERKFNSNWHLAFVDAVLQSFTLMNAGNSIKTDRNGCSLPRRPISMGFSNSLQRKRPTTSIW